MMFKDETHLFAPEFLIEELMEHKEEIMIKTERPYEDLLKFIEVLKRRITFYPYDDFKHCAKRAKKITPDPLPNRA